AATFGEEHGGGATAAGDQGEDKSNATLAALKKDLGEVAFSELSVPSHLLKPAILNPWSADEEAHLLNLVNDLGRKGWQKIANILGTNRTAASVSARWQRLTSLGLTAANPTMPDDPDADTSSGSRKKPNAPSKDKSSKANWKTWNDADDAELRALVGEYGKNSWVRVGRELSRPRSGYASSARWYEHIVKGEKSGEAAESGDLIHLGLPVAEEGNGDGNTDANVEAPPKGKKAYSAKKRWSAEEDLELRSWYVHFGEKYPNDGQRWAAISKKMTSVRPASSCRLRWLNYLSKQPAPPNLPTHLDDSIHPDLGLDIAAVLNQDDHLKFLALLPAHTSAAATAAAVENSIGMDLDIDVGHHAGPSGEKRIFSGVQSEEDELDEEGEDHATKRQRV
ncbi:hypothetical protein P7C70_g6423, partial [Phenoliferia sp. Uapishka_3]